MGVVEGWWWLRGWLWRSSEACALVCVVMLARVVVARRGGAGACVVRGLSMWCGGRSFLRWGVGGGDGLLVVVVVVACGLGLGVCGVCGGWACFASCRRVRRCGEERAWGGGMGLERRREQGRECGGGRGVYAAAGMW